MNKAPEADVDSGEWTILHARNVMVRSFKDDPELRRAYVDNVVMCIYDRLKTGTKLNAIADEILDIIFKRQ